MASHTQPFYTETFKTIYKQELSDKKLFIEKMSKNKQRKLQFLGALTTFAALQMPVVSIISFFPPLKATRDLIAASAMFCGMPLLFILAFIYNRFRELNICLVMRQLQRKYDMPLRYSYTNRPKSGERNAFTFFRHIFSSNYVYTYADKQNIRMARLSELTGERNFDTKGDWYELTKTDLENELKNLAVPGTSTMNAVIFWNMLFTFALNGGNHQLISITGVAALTVIKLCMHFRHTNEKRKIDRTKKELLRMLVFLSNYKKWSSTKATH